MISCARSVASTQSNASETLPAYPSTNDAICANAILRDDCSGSKIVFGLRSQVLPQSGLGKACDYLLGHWTPPTSSPAKPGWTITSLKNAIRPSAIGKKNGLFIGHPDAGQRSAIIYSIVVSCQRHGKDPLAYMKDVLTRLPAMSNQDDLTQLTPAYWIASS